MYYVMPYRKSSKTLNFGHQKLSVVDCSKRKHNVFIYETNKTNPYSMSTTILVFDRVQFANTYHVSAI